ncbi:uncharacterized protein TM35_000112540 [Trypanosoma theileri]|uniref:Trypanosoma Tc-38 (p38) protein domain-containing protein n=1 Tax=Trypanosoma theileri TaxID=67003 RepID=A0A1X0NZZ2_9TRYP|nr:uncharacterized protein TM35_000112540 [Trypanosoma theileri]ORC89720.1 hypothetical protein TM35_000112540 [Trypanosoma theileri]
MTTIRRKAPRLFSGAVFPEETSRGLLEFAQRHNLMSDVWVPKRLVEKLKNGASILPNAILCDVSLIPGCGVIDPEVIGFDTVLVNAAHTTDVDFFERYQDNIMSGAFSPFPLTSRGVPQRENLCKEFTKLGKKNDFKSPYWVKQRSNDRHRVNAEETIYAGRYNPTDCITYEPHTFTNQLFPPAIALLMRRKASQFGYISRTWVTKKEGELHGTRLNTERLKDGPPIFTAYFSGQGNVQPVEYFCADQFEDYTVFPTTREIDLAVCGVFIGENKVRAYPLLASLAVESSAVIRHRRMVEETSKFSSPLLMGLSSNVSFLMQNIEYKERLRKFSLLHGFSQANFILHTPEVGQYLQLKPQEQGIVCSVSKESAKLHSSKQKTFCFFNADQFEEPKIVEEIIERTPTHFFIQIPLYGQLLVDCARQQCIKSGYSKMWIPASTLEYFDDTWKPLPGIVGVPEERTTSEMIIPTLYNISEINIPSDALKWWPTYFPRDAKNKLYLGEVKMLLSMRAWEQGYTSPVWITQALITQMGATRKRWSRRKTFLKGNPFLKPPSVLVGNDEYVNLEEIKDKELFTLNINHEIVDFVTEKYV